MKNLEYFVQRRKQDRLKVKEGAFVEFHKPGIMKLSKPRIIKSAPIISISKTGLEFQYIDHKMWSTNFKELSITMAGDDNVIREVPFKVVSDYAISKHSRAKFIRRCGVKFGKLTSSQKSFLDSFIESHTVHDYTTDRRGGEERRKGEGIQFNGPDMRRGNERRKKRKRE